MNDYLCVALDIKLGQSVTVEKTPSWEQEASTKDVPASVNVVGNAARFLRKLDR